MDYENEWLRNEKKYPYETPQMDKRMQDPMMVSPIYNHLKVAKVTGGLTMKKLNKNKLLYE